MSTALITQRAKTHGEWHRTASIAQRLKSYLADEMDPEHLGFRQREALDMILTKIARIVAGDPRHADHWRDISGYALLGIEFDAAADAAGSYDAAILAIGARVKAGEPLAASGYFAPTRCPDHPLDTTIDGAGRRFCATMGCAWSWREPSE